MTQRHYPTLTCYACRGKAQTMVHITRNWCHLYYISCPACGTATAKCMTRKSAELAWKGMQLDYLVQKRKQQQETAL